MGSVRAVPRPLGLRSDRGRVGSVGAVPRPLGLRSDRGRVGSVGAEFPLVTGAVSQELISA